MNNKPKPYVLVKSKGGIKYYDIQDLEFRSVASNTQEDYVKAGDKLYVTLSSCTYFDERLRIEQWSHNRVYLGKIIYESNKPFKIIEVKEWWD